MADDLSGLARKIDKLQGQFDGRALRTITTRVATAARKDVRAALQRDIGGDRRMHNWKRVILDSGFEIEGDGAAVLKPRPSGPWKVLEKGAAAHTIGAKGRRATGRGSRAVNAARRAARASGERGAYSGSRPLRTPYGPRYSVLVPRKKARTSGKKTWTHARTTIERETGGRVHKEVRRALSEVF